MRAIHGRQQDVKSPPVSQARDEYADEDERALIQRLTASDHEAFETVFQRSVTTVYRQAMGPSGEQAEVEEVVQEVFLTVYEKAHTFHGQKDIPRRGTGQPVSGTHASTIMRGSVKSA